MHIHRGGGFGVCHPFEIAQHDRHPLPLRQRLQRRFDLFVPFRFRISLFPVGFRACCVFVQLAALVLLVLAHMVVAAIDDDAVEPGGKSGLVFLPARTVNP